MTNRWLWTDIEWVGDWDYGHGNFVRKPDLRSEKSTTEFHYDNRANASLRRLRTQEAIALWINKVEADFGVDGQVAQSREGRSYYPRSIQQARFRVSGQAPNSYHFNRLAKFARLTHKDALDGHWIKFYLQEHKPNTKLPRQGIRGPHSQIHVDGYITNVQAGAERFVNAPTYSFEFVVFNAYNFFGWEDKEKAIIQGRQILDVLKDPSTGMTWYDLKNWPQDEKKKKK